MAGQHQLLDYSEQNHMTEMDDLLRLSAELVHVGSLTAVHTGYDQLSWKGTPDIMLQLSETPAGEGE